MYHCFSRQQAIRAEHLRAEHLREEKHEPGDKCARARSKPDGPKKLAEK